MCSRRLLTIRRELEIRSCFLSLSLQLRAILIRAINDVIDRQVNKDSGSGNDSQHAEQLCSTQIHLIQKRLSSELLHCALRIVAYPDRNAPWM